MIKESYCRFIGILLWGEHVANEAVVSLIMDRQDLKRKANARYKCALIIRPKPDNIFYETYEKDNQIRNCDPHDYDSSLM